MNIKLKAKLSAYTKGIIPDASQELITEPGSGLDIETLENKKRKISLRQQILKELPEETEEDITYYIDEQIPNMYIDGGTAFSDGNNDYVDNIEYNQIIDCKKDYDLDLLPINSKGVYNGN